MAAHRSISRKPKLSRNKMKTEIVASGVYQYAPPTLAANAGDTSKSPEILCYITARRYSDSH